MKTLLSALTMLVFCFSVSVPTAYADTLKGEGVTKSRACDDARQNVRMKGGTPTGRCGCWEDSEAAVYKWQCEISYEKDEPHQVWTGTLKGEGVTKSLACDDARQNVRLERGTPTGRCGCWEDSEAALYKWQCEISYRKEDS